MSDQTKEQKKIKHPVKRDLYDFFDSVGIYIGMSKGVKLESHCFFTQHTVGDKIHKENYEGLDRQAVEARAFEIAFMLLDERL